MHYNYRYYQTVLTSITHLSRTLLPSPCVGVMSVAAARGDTIGDQRSERPVWWRHRRGTAGQDTGKQLLPGTAPANTHLTHTYTHIDTCDTHWHVWHVTCDHGTSWAMALQLPAWPRHPGPATLLILWGIQVRRNTKYFFSHSNIYLTNIYLKIRLWVVHNYS